MLEKPFPVFFNGLFVILEKKMVRRQNETGLQLNRPRSICPYCKLTGNGYQTKPDETYKLPVSLRILRYRAWLMDPRNVFIL